MFDILFAGRCIFFILKLRSDINTNFCASLCLVIDRVGHLRFFGFKIAFHKIRKQPALTIGWTKRVLSYRHHWNRAELGTCSTIWIKKPQVPRSGYKFLCFAWLYNIWWALRNCWMYRQQKLYVIAIDFMLLVCTFLLKEQQFFTPYITPFFFTL